MDVFFACSPGDRHPVSLVVGEDSEVTGNLSPLVSFLCTVARNLDQLNCGAKCGSVGPLTVRGPHGMPVSECVGGWLVLVGLCLVARLPWCRPAVAVLCESHERPSTLLWLISLYAFG